MESPCRNKVVRSYVCEQAIASLVVIFLFPVACRKAVGVLASVLFVRALKKSLKMDSDMRRYLLKSETFQFIDDFLVYMLDAKGYFWKPVTKREGLARHFTPKVGKEILNLANCLRSLFQGKFHKVDGMLLESRKGFQTYVWTFGKHLFNDGFQWPKFAALLVFCGELCVFCMDHDREDLVDAADTTVASFILLELFRDLRKQGGLPVLADVYKEELRVPGAN